MNKQPNDSGDEPKNGINGGQGNLIGKDSDYPKLPNEDILPHVVSTEQFDLVKDTISPRVQEVIESVDEKEAARLRMTESVDAITWHQTGLTREDIYWAMMVHEHVERVVNQTPGVDYSKSALARYSKRINTLLRRFRILRELINNSNPKKEGHGTRLWKGHGEVLDLVKATYDKLGIKPNMDARKDPMAATLQWSGEARKAKDDKPDDQVSGDSMVDSDANSPEGESNGNEDDKERSFTLTGYQLAAYLTLVKSAESGGTQVSVRKITSSIEQIRSLYFIYIDLALDRHLYLEQKKSGE